MSLPSKKLVVLGATSNNDLRELIVLCNETASGDRFELVAFLDDEPARQGTSVEGVPVKGPLSLAAEMEDACFINAIGTTTTVCRRKEILAKTRLGDDRYVTLIHPRAIVSPSAVIGPGCLIFAGAVIGSGVQLGKCSDVMPCAVISHDCKIGAYTFIASGVTLGGKVSIGEGCFLGLNSSVREILRIGDRSLLGQGAVVLKDVPENSVVIGNPAKVVRRTQE